VSGAAPKSRLLIGVVPDKGGAGGEDAADEAGGPADPKRAALRRGAVKDLAAALGLDPGGIDVDAADEALSHFCSLHRGYKSGGEGDDEGEEY
jgi:hypothetical protein